MALRSGRVGIHPSQVDPITGMLLDGPTPGSVSLSELRDVDISTPSDGDFLSYEDGEWVNVKDNINDVTTLAVDLQNWSSDITSQSGSTLYKKIISLNNVYVKSPTIDIGASTGYVLPTLAEQASYDLLQYVTVDRAVPCLYLYASAIPTTAFYIKVEGVD